MAEGARGAADGRGGLGRAVVVMVLGMAVVAVGVLVSTRLLGGEARADMTVEEMTAVLLTGADVDRVTVAAGQPYVSLAYADAVDRVGAGFAGAEVGHDVPACRELVQRILPGSGDPSAAAAFERSDGTFLLQTLDIADDDDMSVSELRDWPGSCGFPLVEIDAGRTRGRLVSGMGVRVDDLGDSAFWTSIDVQLTGVPGQPDVVQTGYLHVVVVERDGVVATLTVVAGTDLRDERELALRLAEVADAKLADSL